MRRRNRAHGERGGASEGDPLGSAAALAGSATAGAGPRCPAHFYRRSRRRHGEELVEAEGGALGAPDRGGGGPTVSEQSKAARLRVLQDSISRVVHIFDYSPKPCLEPADVHGTP